MQDHYATLGVAKTATADEIKRAFRRLASQHHPDKGGDTARFQEIQAAYDVLGNEEKRRAYDNPSRPFNFQDFGQGQQFNNVHDIFAQMFGGGFGGFPGGQHPRRNHVRMSLWVSFADSVRGANKTVQVGTTQGSNTVEIAVPPGIEDGDNVQYSGIAPGGMDLVVQFRVSPDPQWQRQGLNLFTERRVPVWDLILGGDLEINNVQGATFSMRIPAGTQPGTNMRVRGQGVRNQSGQQGDMFVRLQAEIPQNISQPILDAIRQHK